MIVNGIDHDKVRFADELSSDSLGWMLKGNSPEDIKSYVYAKYEGAYPLSLNSTYTVVTPVGRTRDPHTGAIEQYNYAQIGEPLAWDTDELNAICSKAERKRGTQAGVRAVVDRIKVIYEANPPQERSLPEDAEHTAPEPGGPPAKEYKGELIKELPIYDGKMVTAEWVSHPSDTDEAIAIVIRKPKNWLTWEIARYHVAPALDLFFRKSEDYGDTANSLGAKGQFADLWRKIGKLKRFIWDGAEHSFEGPIEIYQDVIGHSLLGIYYQELEKAKAEDKAQEAAVTVQDAVKTAEVKKQASATYDTKRVSAGDPADFWED